MTEAEAREQLAAALGTESFELSRRERRWLALGDDLVAFAADDEAGRDRLGRERWLLERWRAAGIPAPRVVSDRGHVQVRERLAGITGDGIEPMIFGGAPPADRYAADTPISPFGLALAASYGELAARIRRAVPVADAIAAGFDHGSRRALDLELAFARFHACAPAAAAKADRLRAWLADVPPPDTVIHGDLHFHNMCLATDGAIVGVFDLDDAGIDAAATELLYVHSLGPAFVEAALAAYGVIARDAVWRAHLRTALDHLIWHGPGTPRHTSVVAWVTAAFECLP